MKMYLKGGAGIENPLDVDGKQIKEGSILSFDYYDPFYSDEFFEKHYPKMTKADIMERKNKPVFIVKKDENGILFGEGIEEPKGLLVNAGKLYLHDFRFKYTKVLA